MTPNTQEEKRQGPRRVMRSDAKGIYGGAIMAHYTKYALERLRVQEEREPKTQKRTDHYPTREQKKGNRSVAIDKPFHGKHSGLVPLGRTQKEMTTGI